MILEIHHTPRVMWYFYELQNNPLFYIKWNKAPIFIINYMDQLSMPSELHNGPKNVLTQGYYVVDSLNPTTFRSTN